MNHPDVSEDTRTRRPGLADPVGALVALASLGVFAAHGFEGELTRDLGIYAYAGQTVADGEPPYVGVMNRSGPLAHLVPGVGAAAARLVGANDLLGMRVLFLVLSVLCVWVVYLVARDLYETRFAGVVAAGLLVCIPGFIFYATGGPREKTTMMLLFALALLAAVHRRWAWAGVAVALTTLTWQPAFLPLVVAVAGAALLAPRGERLRGLAAIVAGGTVTTALTAAYFAAAGAFGDFLDGFVLIHLRYTYQTGMYDDLEAQWEGLVGAFETSLNFVIAGLGLTLVLAARNLLVRRRRHDHLGRVQIIIGVATLVGLVWSWRVFNGWADALVLVPLAALGLAGLAAWLGELLPRTAATALVAAWVVVVAALGLDWSLNEGSRLLPKQQRESDAVFAALPADATLFSVEAPQPLVLTGRTNLTQHQMFRAGLIFYVDASWPGGLAGYAADVSAAEPTVIAIGRYARFAWVRPILGSDYTAIGTSPGWTWYVRDDQPPGVLEELRAAVAG